MGIFLFVAVIVFGVVALFGALVFAIMSGERVAPSGKLFTMWMVGISTVLTLVISVPIALGMDYDGRRDVAGLTATRESIDSFLIAVTETRKGVNDPNPNTTGQFIGDDGLINLRLGIEASERLVEMRDTIVGYNRALRRYQAKAGSFLYGRILPSADHLQVIRAEAIP